MAGPVPAVDHELVNEQDVATLEGHDHGIGPLDPPSS